MRNWIVALAALALTAGARAQDLTPTVETDREQYGSGQAVAIVVGLTNNMVAPWQVAVPVGRYEYEIVVRDSRTRRIVWNWSRGKQASRGFTFTLPAGQGRVHRELWDGKDNDGRPMPSGVYEIEAWHYPAGTSACARIYLGGRRGEDGRPPRASATGVVGTLRCDRGRARVGDWVSCTYLVRNDSDDPVELTFASTRQFDLEARLGGRCVWRYSRDRIESPVIVRMTLQPGERRRYTASFQIAEGTAPGTYDLVAYLTPYGANDGAVAVGAATLQVTR